jgi:putative transcriptional regulator
VTSLRTRQSRNAIMRVRYRIWQFAAAAGFALIALLGAAPPMAEPHEASAKSFLLVASRSMPDPVFQKSVILILPADEPPLVAGVIINKPTNVTMGNLFKQPVAPENQNQKVYFGGPVDLTTPLLIVRTTQTLKPAIPLWTNVYAVDDADLIGDILKDSRSGNNARLYLGRAQWTQDQLRGELLEGAWSVVPVRTDLIFEHDSGKIWPMLSQHEHVREVNALCFETGGVPASTTCSGALTW